MAVSSMNRWWQNWPKTHAYVAEKAFFPTSVSDIASAIQEAEMVSRPLRAVGGGWSFTDATLPGSVTTNRPNAYGVEALAEALVTSESAVTVPPTAVSVATVPSGLPNPDIPGSMVMVAADSNPPVVDPSWTYLGAGLWRQGNVSYNDDALVYRLAGNGFRPIRTPAAGALQDADVPGSLMMFDMAPTPPTPIRDWFYDGQGNWSVGVMGDSDPPIWGTLGELSGANRLLPAGINLSPRAANPSDGLFQLLTKAPGTMATPEHVYIIDTRGLVSSLQRRLPAILSDEAAAATTETPPAGSSRRFFFHVEGGITSADLGFLLAHQSPPLTIQAISGSPGATIAGAISTGTHGAEFNWPLLIDRVKAVHLVGPGGLQWWIEGSESIADPAKLLAAYPDIAPERIIRGTDRVGGILPQDWLKAAVVSMGSMGVIYSIVLEVVPVFGVREVVLQKIWGMTGTSPSSSHLFVGTRYEGQTLANLLRSSATATDVSERLVTLMQNGDLSGTGIPRIDAAGNLINQYADLAFNPNPRGDGELDIWIGNRQVTTVVPIDPQPPAGNETAAMINGITRVFADPDLSARLRNIYGFGNFVQAFLNFGATGRKVDRLTQATDFADVALDTFVSPMLDQPDGPAVAQGVLTGLLSGLLGTANTAQRSDKTGVSVGARGFPDSGIMGTGLEIALAPSDAFGFLQSEILDKVQLPFLGYISVRLCSPTETLMGMQQFSTADNACSVMIEVVGYGDPQSRSFMADLQQRTVNRIYDGLGAMLHWGLENDRLKALQLGKLNALRQPSLSGPSKLNTFKSVRALVHQAAATGTFRVFDNGFTERLGLSTLGGLVFCDAAGNPIDTWNPVPSQAPPGTPFVEGSRTFTEDLLLRNPTADPVVVTAVRITSSADTANHAVFDVGSSLPFTVPPAQRVGLVVQFEGGPPGPVTGTVEIDCGLDPMVSIGFSAQVAAQHAELQLTPASFDFGSVLAGTIASQLLTMTNIGASDAILVDANGDSTLVVTPAGPFSLAPVYPASDLPGGVAAGQQALVQVVYQPQARGLAQATLGIDVRSRTGSSAIDYLQHDEIPLQGRALAPKVFLAPGPPGPIRQLELRTLDFGAAPPATHLAASFWIRNVGDAPLTVQGVEVPNQGSFGIPNVTIFPATLPPRGEMEVPCDFLAPPVAGLPAAATFSVLTDDPARPSADLRLIGRAAGPHLAPPPEALDLGTVTPENGSATIALRSDGTDPVTLRKVSFAIGTDFSLSGLPPIPAQIAPGDEIQLTVSLKSTTPGNHQDRLLLADDGPTPNFQVNLNANVP